MWDGGGGGFGAGQYYAHPQNKFWRTLYAVGLTPRLFLPAEFALLDGLGIGLTDIAKHVSGMDAQLPRGSLGAAAVAELRARIALYAPTILAFTSLTGGRRVMGGDAVFGRQRAKIGGTEVWILPSPSPAAHWNWDETHWHALARRVAQLP